MTYEQPTQVCRSRPEMWFATAGTHEQRAAKEACGHCAIRRACGQGAYDRTERRGVWAGFDVATERAALYSWLHPDQQAISGEVTAVCKTCSGTFYHSVSRQAAANICPGCAFGLVDASACWPILDALVDHGYTRTDIADLSGVARNVILKMTKSEGRQRYTRPITVEAILSMPLPGPVSEAVGVAA